MKQYLERRINERVESGESGFTLIELLVVMLIILILLAIAIPTFLGIINNAHNTGAASNLGNAIIEASADYTQDSGNFGQTATAVVPELQSLEPSLVFQTTAINTTNDTSGTNNAVQIDACSNAGSTCQWVAMSAWASASGVCYYVFLNKGPQISATTITGTAWAGSAISGGNLPQGVTYGTSGTKVMNGGCDVTKDAVGNAQTGGFPAA
jgi:type IV pilus assembly protein PilA